MSDQWYYGSNGQQHGPVTGANLRQRAAAGTLRGDDLVWREGMAEWTRLAAVPEFADVVVVVASAAAYDMAPAAAPAAFVAQPPPAAMMGYYAGGYGEGIDRLAPAGFWLRFVAFIIDSVLMNVVGFIIGFAIGFTLGVVMGGPEAGRLASGLASVAQLVVSWVYFAAMESSPRQATLGKMALGIRVVGASGERITFARGSGRFFAKILSYVTIFIGFIMAGLTERKQALHDLIATTYVVRNAPGYPSR